MKFLLDKEKEARGCQPSTIMHPSTEEKCVSPCFPGLDQWWIDVPIKRGNWEYRKLFCTLWFLCEIIIGILLVFGAVSSQSVSRSHCSFFKIKVSLGHKISETLKCEVLFVVEPASIWFQHHPIIFHSFSTIEHK